jgi:hypothetical protein
LPPLQRVVLQSCSVAIHGFPSVKLIARRSVL